MNKWYIKLILIVGVLLTQFSLGACGKDDNNDSINEKKQDKQNEVSLNTNEEEQKDSYEELKDREKAAINNFIKLNDMKIISEAQFQEQDYSTDVSKNEYVLFANNGVYMQIVRKGCGSVLQSNETKSILVRFSEQNILDPTDIRNNFNATAVDQMMITYQGGTYIATFVEGLMFSSYGSSVPNGWLTPFPYIKIGSSISPDEEIAKVRLIVPHTLGHQYATMNVIPYYYEITFQLSRT